MVNKFNSIVFLLILFLGAFAFNVYFSPKTSLSKVIDSVPVPITFYEKNRDIQVFHFDPIPPRASRLLVTEEDKIDPNELLEFYRTWAELNDWEIIKLEPFDLQSPRSGPEISLSKEGIRLNISIDVVAFVQGDGTSFLSDYTYNALTEHGFMEKENMKWIVNINVLLPE